MNIKKAAEAHTNLNLWGVIVAILEGGTLYGGRGNDAKRRIIQICHAEIQKELRIFDSECTKDVRSQAKDTQGREAAVSDDHDEAIAALRRCDSTKEKL